MTFDAGIPTTRMPYPEGEAGIQMSLQMMAQKIREGAPTAVMKSFAGNILKQAGFPRMAAEKGAALLAYVRKNVGYVPDAPGTEQIQSAAVSLCVDGAPVCIPIGDCDDVSVALATLCGAAGMETRIVRQIYGSGQQQHVLVEIHLEDGRWYPLDPSSKSLPPGQKAFAARETTLNPWQDAAKIGLSEDAEFVGIGKVGALPVYVMTTEGWRQAPAATTLGADADGRWWLPIGAGGVEQQVEVAKAQPGTGLVSDFLSDGIDQLRVAGSLSTETKIAMVAAGVLSAAALAALFIHEKRSR